MSRKNRLEWGREGEAEKWTQQVDTLYVHILAPSGANWYQLVPNEGADVKIEDTYGYQRDEAIRRIEEQRAAIRKAVASQGLLVRPFVWLYFKARMWKAERLCKKLVRQRDGPA